MRIRMGDLRCLLREGADYVVRGSEVFVRPVNGSPDDWRPWVLQKVTYFSDEELVRKPNGPTSFPVHVFKRDGMLYAVEPRQFFKRTV